LQSEAELIKSEAKIAQKKAKQEAEISHQKALDDLEISKARDLADIEASKFKSIVDAIGASTLEAIAQAGPEMQAKLLGGLGLQSFMLTGSDNPIGLFSSL